MVTMRTILPVAVAALLAAGPSAAHAQTVDDWREDLRVLATEVPKRHPNAFAKTTREQWDGAVKALDARLPQLKRHEVIVEFMRLVALVGDGHTAIVPEADERIGFHRFPIQLYDFYDGLFIISADSAHANLVGAKVITIGPSSSAAAVQTVGRVISRESPNWIRARAASLLAIPEVLAALGMGRDSLSAEFVVEQPGREVKGKATKPVQIKITLVGTGAAGGNAHMAPAQQVNMRRESPGEDPLWQRLPALTWWFRIAPDNVLYINHRAVSPFADGETNEAFFRRAFAAGDSAKVERVVLDIRTNGGGNNFMNRNIVKEIIRRPDIDKPDRLIVLIGRGVFSAAQNLVNELDYYTNATFVGEPTGNAPNQYGDARPLQLPRSQLTARVSSLLWQSHQAGDNRTWFTPDFYAEMSSEDYRTKQDPVLTTALRRATGTSLGRKLRDVAELGDTSAVREQITSYRSNDENKYRNVEADVNSAGYELLRDGNTVGAVTVFTVNTQLYPRSGNTFDSLGEALEKAGKRDEAVTAYRKALDLNPGLFSSRDALRRLAP
jgi:tetratricopeptide (TPR) repeat protein